MSRTRVKLRDYWAHAVLGLLYFWLSACGQTGEADFTLGPDPSVGFGPYERTNIVESPHGQEFSWITAAPCPNETLVLLGGSLQEKQTWFTEINTLDATPNWHEVTSAFPHLLDASVHCSASHLTILLLEEGLDSQPAANLVSVTGADLLTSTQLERTRIDIETDWKFPNLRISPESIDALFVQTSDGIAQLVGTRFERDTSRVQHSLSEDVKNQEAQRDLSLRMMQTTNGELRSIITSFGKLDGTDTTWMLQGATEDPRSIETGESYASHTWFRWRGAYWVAGTRLRPTVPLGAVFSREQHSIPTLYEVH